MTLLVYNRLGLSGQDSRTLCWAASWPSLSKMGPTASIPRTPLAWRRPLNSRLSMSRSTSCGTATPPTQGIISSGTVNNFYIFIEKWDCSTRILLATIQSRTTPPLVPMKLFWCLGEAWWLSGSAPDCCPRFESGVSPAHSWLPIVWWVATWDGTWLQADLFEGLRGENDEKWTAGSPKTYKEKKNFFGVLSTSVWSYWQSDSNVPTYWHFDPRNFRSVTFWKEKPIKNKLTTAFWGTNAPLKAGSWSPGVARSVDVTMLYTALWRANCHTEKDGF